MLARKISKLGHGEGNQLATVIQTQTLIFSTHFYNPGPQNTVHSMNTEHSTLSAHSTHTVYIHSVNTVELVHTVHSVHIVHIIVYIHSVNT